MGKKTKEWFVCDRCGVEIERPFRGGESGTYHVKFNADYAVAGESLEWRELCVDCNHYIGMLMSEEKNKANPLPNQDGNDG